MLFRAYKQKCEEENKRKQLNGSTEWKEETRKKPSKRPEQLDLRIRRLRSHFDLDSIFRLAESGAKRTRFLSAKVQKKNKISFLT